MIPPTVIIDTIKKMRGEESFRIEAPIKESKLTTFFVCFLLIFCIVALIGIVGFMVFSFCNRY